jgi:hypothetical protein
LQCATLDGILGEACTFGKYALYSKGGGSATDRHYGATIAVSNDKHHLPCSGKKGQGLLRLARPHDLVNDQRSRAQGFPLSPTY